MRPQDCRRHWHRSDHEYKSRAAGKRSPTDGAQTAIVSWLWGCHRPSVLQAFVLGYSLRRHKTKADLILCVERATLESPTFRWAHLLRTFWHVVPVEHLPTPARLHATVQARLEGVYSKLQTWQLFSHGERSLRLVLMMDLDMLARRNIDDLFQTRAPAAVMRGPTDSCLHAPRPRASFFRGGSVHHHEETGEPMTGGINAGLVLLQPDGKVFREMYKKLEDGWTTKTKMAEQEFLSYFFGDSEAWQSLHKKFNFQVHQLYLCGGPKPPPGQETSSSYWEMARAPDEIAVWHFSSRFKPDRVLDMMDRGDFTDQGACIDRFVEEFTEAELSRRYVNEEEVRKHLESVILPCNRRATEEWLVNWQESWPFIVLYVADFAARRCLQRRSDGNTRCLDCNAVFEGDVPSSVLRDHLLVNCPALRRDIEIRLCDIFDLDKLMQAPCGRRVDCQLNYLAKVLDYYSPCDTLCNPAGLEPLTDEGVEEIYEPTHVKSSMQTDFLLRCEARAKTEEEIAEENAASDYHAAKARWHKLRKHLERIAFQDPYRRTRLGNAEDLSYLRKACCVRATLNKRLCEGAAHKRQRTGTSSTIVQDGSSASSSTPEVLDFTHRVPPLPPPPPPPPHANGASSSGGVKRKTTDAGVMRPQCKKRARTLVIE